MFKLVQREEIFRQHNSLNLPMEIGQISNAHVLDAGDGPFQRLLGAGRQRLGDLGNLAGESGIQKEDNVAQPFEI